MQVGTASEAGGLGMNFTTWTRRSVTLLIVFAAASTTQSVDLVAKIPYGFASGNCPGTRFLWLLVHTKLRLPTPAPNVRSPPVVPITTRPICFLTIAAKSAGALGGMNCGAPVMIPWIECSPTAEMPSTPVAPEPSGPAIEKSPVITRCTLCWPTHTRLILLVNPAHCSPSGPWPRQVAPPCPASATNSLPSLVNVRSRGLSRFETTVVTLGWDVPPADATPPPRTRHDTAAVAHATATRTLMCYPQRLERPGARTAEGLAKSTAAP